MNVMEQPVVSQTRRSKMSCAILISGYENNNYFSFNDDTNDCHGYISGPTAPFTILPGDFAVYEITSMALGTPKVHLFEKTLDF